MKKMLVILAAFVAFAAPAAAQAAKPVPTPCTDNCVTPIPIPPVTE